MNDKELVKKYQENPTKEIWSKIFERHYRAIFQKVLFKLPGVNNTNVWESSALSFAVLSIREALLKYDVTQNTQVLTWIINTLKLHFKIRFNSEEYGSLWLKAGEPYEDVFYNPEDDLEQQETSRKPLFKQLDSRRLIDNLDVTNPEGVLVAKALLGIDCNKTPIKLQLRLLTTSPHKGDEILKGANLHSAISREHF